MAVAQQLSSSKIKSLESKLTQVIMSLGSSQQELGKTRH
jgi:hypothetical protein